MSSPAPEPTPGLAAVQAWCGWHIAPLKSETVEVEGEGGRVLLLPSLHVTDCSEVRDESDATVTGWKVRSNGVARGSWRSEELYAFDITHGYDEMPDEVMQVIEILDRRLAENPTGAVRQTAGPFNITFSQTGFNQATPLALLEGELALLARYRIPPRA